MHQRRRPHLTQEVIAQVITELESHWQTQAELAQTCGVASERIGWVIREIGHTRPPVFCRHRSVRLREYRIVPEAVQVRGVDDEETKTLARGVSL